MIFLADTVLELGQNAPHWVDDRSANCTSSLVFFDPINGRLQFYTQSAYSRNSWTQSVVFTDWESFVTIADPATQGQKVPPRTARIKRRAQVSKPPRDRQDYLPWGDLYTEEEEEEVVPEAVPETVPEVETKQTERQPWGWLYEEDRGVTESSTWEQVWQLFPELINAEVKVHCNCLTGDTKIPLLDGRVLTLEEIHKEFGSKKKFWVYSTDHKGEFKPGKAHSLGITKYVTKLYHVTLDNGKTVKCTAEHPFMLRDGTYVQAKDLVSGTSLMPLYLRDKKVYSSSSGRDYTQFKSNSEPGWKFVFRSVAETALAKERETKRSIESVRVVRLEKPIPVYDITVDRWENFLVEQGVIVHNCPAYLYWGSQYLLEQRDTALINQGVPAPTLKRPENPHGREPPASSNMICKHLAAVLKQYF